MVLVWCCSPFKVSFAKLLAADCSLKCSSSQVPTSTSTHAVAAGAVWCVCVCVFILALPLLLVQTAGGWVAKVRWQKAEGGLARVKGKEFTPEDGKSGGTHSVHASAICCT